MDRSLSVTFNKQQAQGKGRGRYLIPWSIPRKGMGMKYGYFGQIDPEFQEVRNNIDQWDRTSGDGTLLLILRQSWRKLS